MASKINFVVPLKELLEQERDRADSILTTADIGELLAAEDAVVDASPRTSIIGYPSRPLYREIGTILNTWMETRRCPLLDLPTYDLLDEKEYVENRVASIGDIQPKFIGLTSLWDDWSIDERVHSLRDIIIKLGGKRGLLDLLGMRKTVGTHDLWPPPRKILEATFLSRHKPESDSILSVGARALAKHSHRDESTSWWGVCTGSESAKNSKAENIMETILDDAHWINVHQLPHDVQIIEARQRNGYGVRWNSDGKQFRGFLEPQMAGGHDVGWRH